MSLSGAAHRLVMKANWIDAGLRLALSLALVMTSCVTVFADPVESRGLTGLALQSGDIVFQDSSPHSGQARAIKALTRSRWSHCGIFFDRPGVGAVVIDGNGRGPVISWDQWRSGGEGGKFVAFRLKQSMDSSQIERLWKSAQQLDRRVYDLKFAWDDDRIYCSELIWKAYRNALKIELCPLGMLSDFDLESKLARPLIERKGSWATIENVRAHSTEPVVSPQALTESERLRRVSE